MTIGKIAGGFLLDRFWPFAIAAVITGLAAVGAAGLASVDMDSPYLLIALLTSWIGLAQGAEADFIAFFVLRSFGMRKFSTIVGVLAMVVTLGLTLGALVYGALYDVAGSYNAASYLGASCLVAASILILAAGACEIRVKRKQAASS